jgi:hypothetical protein
MWSESWGAMIWGGGMVAPVPALGPVGWILLGAMLGVLGVHSRGRLSKAGAGLAFLGIAALPFAGMAAQVVLPHTFSNGTVADATEVNANFVALEAESNNQDDRILALEGPAFDSGWVAVSGNAQVTVNHGLGVIPSRVSVQVASSSSPSTVYIGGAMWQYLDGEGGRGTVVTDLTSSSLKIRTGRSSACPVFDTYLINAGSNRVCLSSGYARVLVWE